MAEGSGGSGAGAGGGAMGEGATVLSDGGGAFMTAPERDRRVKPLFATIASPSSPVRQRTGESSADDRAGGGGGGAAARSAMPAATAITDW
ncbi:hypothetical protein [Sphingomonas prati]|uniref:Uncharacterized protein n=1 Tax=Sphingomonas prati TaxID=1843237 RepID=A0A7W9F3E2_9SPHN|nr:hypothetical protein [Sphingomonas prati]MBB5729754.1 hypothetical protein [Sphingomonas prati]